MTGPGGSADDFEARVKARLEQQADALDAKTSERLRVARRAALDALPRARDRRVPRWLPAGALAAALALLVVLVVNTSRPPDDLWVDPIAASDDVMDLEILSSEDDLEMLEELAFYRWLADSGETG